jgi:hypothetical protein
MEQLLVLVLAMELEQDRAQLAQRRDGDARLVDPGAAPAFARDLAAHDDLAVGARDAPRIQECERPMSGTDLESRLEARAALAGADRVGLGTAAGQEVERGDEQ